MTRMRCPMPFFSAKATRVRGFRELVASDEASRARTLVARRDARDGGRIHPLRARFRVGVTLHELRQLHQEHGQVEDALR